MTQSNETSMCKLFKSKFMIVNMCAFMEHTIIAMRLSILVSCIGVEYLVMCRSSTVIFALVSVHIWSNACHCHSHRLRPIREPWSMRLLTSVIEAICARIARIFCGAYDPDSIIDDLSRTTQCSDCFQDLILQIIRMLQTRTPLFPLAGADR